MKPASLSKYIIVLFALIKLLIPFVLIHPDFELHRDEFLYLADADHLAWGYIEMPPLLALMGYISKLLGGTIATVYMWGSITGALTLILVGMTVIRLKGNPRAVFIACLAFLCSGFLRMHILFQPNFLDVLFWTWAGYLTVRWIQTEDKKYLYWLGICFGLGILGKYSMAFYIISFLVAVLLTGRRKWLLNIHFYLAMLTGILICLPNLVWQYTHHFPVMHHMELLQRQQLQYNSRSDFLISQVLMTLPGIVVWVGGLVYVLFLERGRKYISIGIIYLGIISILLFFNGKGYYAVAAYPVLMAFGGVWFEEITMRKTWLWLKWVMPVLMLLLTIRILPALLPYRSAESLAKFYTTSIIGKTGALVWEDHKTHPLPQDFADMLGWEEMAQKTARIYHSLPDSVQKKTMIYGDNYGEAGALNFYRKKYRLPETYSDNASYVFWLPDHFEYNHFLFITDDLPDPDDVFFQHWHTIQILDSVTTKYARERGTRIILYSNPDDSAKIIAEQNIFRDKKEFGMK